MNIINITPAWDPKQWFIFPIRHQWAVDTPLALFDAFGHSWTLQARLGTPGHFWELMDPKSSPDPFQTSTLDHFGNDLIKIF